MTSSTSNNTKRLSLYLLASVVCGLFSFTYEHFSHNVYSNYMVFLFAIPLLLGAVPELIGRIAPKLAARKFWQGTVHAFAVATLTTGSLLQGVLDIYGTTSPYTAYYFLVGISLLILSAIMRAITFTAYQRSPGYSLQDHTIQY